MNLGSLSTVPAGDTLLNTASAPGRPGSQAYTRDGRRFRLVKAGAAAIAGGVMVQGPVPNIAHVTLTPTVDVPIGSKTIRVTAGAGAGANAPANGYAGGLAIISTGPGQGQALAIRGNDQIVAAAAFNVYLESDESVLVALTNAASKVDLIANPYSGVVIGTGSATAAQPVGATLGPIDAGNWGFVQVEGLASLLADGAIAAGAAISPSVTVPGAVVINSTTLPIVGSAVFAAIGGRAFAAQLALP